MQAQYSTIRELGRGAMGVVSLVRRKHDGRLFAAKEVHFGSDASDAASLHAARDRVMEEVRMLRSVPQHPSVVALEEVYETHEALTMVMEYVDGGTLAETVYPDGNAAGGTEAQGTVNLFESYDPHFGSDAYAGGGNFRTDVSYIAEAPVLPQQPSLASEPSVAQRPREPLDEAVVDRWLFQLCNALNFLHGLGIIHRDIKLQNILVVPGGQVVKLSDFGVATNGKDAFAQTTVGTPHYMAPELCDGRQYNAKCDVWALGVVAYELCNGRPPFSAGNPLALAAKILEQEVPPVDEMYSDGVRRLIMGMLTKDPAARPTPAECVQSIKAYRKERRLKEEAEEEARDARGRTFSRSAVGRATTRANPREGPSAAMGTVELDAAERRRIFEEARTAAAANKQRLRPDASLRPASGAPSPGCSPGRTPNRSPSRSPVRIHDETPVGPRRASSPEPPMVQAPVVVPMEMEHLAVSGRSAHTALPAPSSGPTPRTDFREEHAGLQAANAARLAALFGHSETDATATPVKNVPLLHSAGASPSKGLDTLGTLGGGETTHSDAPAPALHDDFSPMASEWSPERPPPSGTALESSSVAIRYAPGEGGAQDGTQDETQDGAQGGLQEGAHDSSTTPVHLRTAAVDPNSTAVADTETQELTAAVVHESFAGSEVLASPTDGPSPTKASVLLASQQPAPLAGPVFRVSGSTASSPAASPAHGAHPLVCEHCIRSPAAPEPQATKRCCDCGAGLCDECAKEHRLVMHHRLVPLHPEAAPNERRASVSQEGSEGSVPAMPTCTSTHHTPAPTPTPHGALHGEQESPRSPVHRRPSLQPPEEDHSPKPGDTQRSPVPPPTPLPKEKKNKEDSGCCVLQ